MSSNRIGPPGPPSEPQRGSGAADSKKFREELQRIQEVHAVDPDEESRNKNKFLPVQPEDENTPENVKRAPPLSVSPFDVNFQQEIKVKPSSQARISQTSSGKNQTAPQPRPSPTPSPGPRASQSTSTGKNPPIPSPAYSPAPTTNEFYTSSGSTSSSSLPNSQQFWGTVDMPGTSSDQTQNLQETSSTQNRSFSSQSNYDSSKTDQNQSADNDDDTDDEEEDLPIPLKEEPFSSKKPQDATLQKGAEQSPGLETKIQAPTVQGKKKKTTSLGLPGGTKEPSLSPFDLAAKTNAPTKQASPPLSEPEASLQNLASEIPTLDRLSGQQSPENLPLTSLANPEEEMGLPPAPNQRAPAPSFQEQSGKAASAPTGKVLPPAPSTSSSKDSSTGKEGQSQTPGQTSATIVQPAVPQFAPDIQPLAQAAATQAAPYLTADTMALFYQMVGTIYVMTAPTGISRTEIVLNTPAFATSKFFGSTITIEKYATAPDSLNIRLTGSNEAVQSFNQNISSLVAAFEQGKFAFRIGRIEASYQTVDKPVFRRKERGGEKDSGAFKDLSS